MEYFCNPGFRISAGNRLRRCQKNEKWTGSLPICEGMHASLRSHSTLCIEEPFVCVCVSFFDLNPMLPFQTVFFLFCFVLFFSLGGGEGGEGAQGGFLCNVSTN